MGASLMSLTLSRGMTIFLVLAPALLLLLLFLFAPVSSFYNEISYWVFTQQRAFHSMMTSSLGKLADDVGVDAAWAVVFGSFLYGVFHAAGPGHGKVILSTYLLSQPEQIGKSVWIAIAAAFLQGLVAILLVYGLFYVFGLVPKESRLAVLWSERLSYLVVIGIGGWLLWRGLNGLRTNIKATIDAKEHNHHVHSPSDGHHHHGDGEICSSCGHAHAPSANQVKNASDIKTIASVIFSIGLRPCSGAVLVLVFAKFSGIAWAGVAAVAAMSLGTAITVSALAVVAVQLRKFALRLMGTRYQFATYASHVFALAGGCVLIALGYGLFVASYSQSVRLMGL